MLLVLLPCCTVHIYFKQKGKEPHLEKAGEPLPLSWDGWTGWPGVTADQGKTSELQRDRLDTSNISGVLPIKQPAQPFPSLSLTLCHIFSTANVGATLMQSVGHEIRTDPIRDQRDHK